MTVVPTHLGSAVAVGGKNHKGILYLRARTENAGENISGAGALNRIMAQLLGPGVYCKANNSSKCCHRQYEDKKNRTKDITKMLHRSGNDVGTTGETCSYDPYSMCTYLGISYV
jgi:hypothetical protein